MKIDTLVFSASLTALVLLTGCATPGPDSTVPKINRDAASLMIVDCLLPPQVRQLGRQLTYLAPRRAIKTQASLCETRGGEYVAYDRANFRSALTTWLPQAQQGDAEAQTYVGEIYEKGLGVPPDHALAAQWYERAAAQGHSRAQINLGYLYEVGIGVERNLTTAMNYYRDASGLTDGDIEYVSSIESANRVVAREQAEALKIESEQLRRELDALKNQYSREQAQQKIRQDELAALRQAVQQQRSEVVAATTTAEQDSDTGTAAALQRIETLESRLQTARAEQQRLNQALEQKQAETDALRRRYASTHRELFDRQAELKKTQTTLDTLQRRLEAEEQNRNTLLPDIESARQRASQLEQQIDRLKQSESATAAQIGELIRSAEQAEASASEALDRQADDIARLTAARASEQADYEQSLASLQQSLASSREEQLRLANDLATAQLSETQSRQSNAELRGALQEQSALVAASESRQRQLQQTLNSMRSSAGTADADLQATEEALAATNETLSTYREELQRLSDKLQSTQIAARQQQLDSEQQLAALELALEQRESQVLAQQADLDALQSRLSRSRVQITERDVEKVSDLLAAGPAIDILTPPVLLTRGKPEVPLRRGLELIGQVSPSSSLYTFQINGEEQPVNDSGIFRYTPGMNQSAVEMVAIDEAGASTRLQLNLDTTISDASSAPSTTDTPAPSLSGLNFGGYYALIIGNDNYAAMSRLKTASSDARAVERVLRERYGFKTRLLLDASRIQILEAISTLQQSLTESDNLVVYYAGHGELDRDSGRGFWLPVDADPADTQNWIANSAITSQIDAMRAKHVLIIADSCYSGTLTRSSVARQLPSMSNDQKQRWYKAMTRSKVRTVLSSGGVKPVFDGAPGATHSVFARVFLEELESNRDVLEVYRLFFNVQQKVSLAAQQLNVDQTPQYAPIRHSGHEAGEFLFVPAARLNAG